MREGKARIPTEAERKRLLALCRVQRHGQRNAAILQTSYRLGLRAKEIAALSVDDVFDGTYLREELTLTARMTKGGKARTLYLSNPVLRASLLDYLVARQTREGILFNLRAPLYPSQRASRFSPNTLQQLFHRLYAAAGIHGARSHSGRRFFATELIHKGVDLKSVSVLMGHASVAMTARYADDNPQKLRRILAELL